MLYLKKLSPEDGRDVYEMLQEIDADENGFGNAVAGMPYAEYVDWLSQQYAFDRGIGLLDWMVPQSSYWLYQDAAVVGVGRIRHCLNDNLRETGGHIGYAIRKTRRGQGYGNKILALLLEECKALKIDRVQIGANVDNLASHKVILRNGGKWFKEHDGKNFYIVDLAGGADAP
jgi:predicted acetyltransferase